MITSLDNKKVKEWTKLHNKKYRENEYLILDENMVNEAFNTGYLKTLIYVGSIPFNFKNNYEVSKEVMERISKTKNKRYIGVGKPISEELVLNKRILILEDLQDPLNIGKCFENAYLFGFETVILSENCADIYHPRCIENAGSSLYKLNICHNNIDELIAKLHENNYGVYATGLKDHSKELYEVENKEKMAFILGNEGSGVKDTTFDICDEVVKIDMHNIDSLNVAMAGAIVMYRFNNIS